MYLNKKTLIPALFSAKSFVFQIKWINEIKYSHHKSTQMANEEDQNSDKQNNSSFVSLNLSCSSQVQVNHNIVSNKQHHGYDRT
jgi:hypothetical protein